MKAAIETSNKQNQSKAVANRVSQQKNNSQGDSEFVDNRPETKALKNLQMMINGSSRMVAQRQTKANIIGGTDYDIKGANTNVKKNNPKIPLEFGDNGPGPAAGRLKSAPNDSAGSSKFIRLYAPSRFHNSSGVKQLKSRQGITSSNIQDQINSSNVVQLFGLTSETSQSAPDGTDDGRTIVGIGEKITVAVDSGAEADWNIEEGEGSIDSDSGSSTLFTASKTPTNPNKIKATINQESEELDFEVIAPTDMSATVTSNPGFDSGLGNDEIGAESHFKVEVEPLDVSFYEAEFRENIPGEAVNAPSGASIGRDAEEVEWDVDSSNETTDELSTFENINVLHDGMDYQDFNYDIRVPEEYKNEADDWASWAPDETHGVEFRGSDQKGRMGITGEWGDWQGPWAADSDSDSDSGSNSD